MLATVYVFKYSRLYVLRCVTSEVKVMRVPCTIYHVYLEPFLGICILSKMYSAWDEKKVYLNFSVLGKSLTKIGT